MRSLSARLRMIVANITQKDVSFKFPLDPAGAFIDCSPEQPLQNMSMEIISHLPSVQYCETLPTHPWDATQPESSIPWLFGVVHSVRSK